MENENLGHKPKIGVALGGGGMCGIAHIGFLQGLIENGIEIDMISGISMGAIVGGLYASGMDIYDIEKLAKKIAKKDVIELNYFKMLKEGVVSGKKIERFLTRHLITQNIEDAKIKFMAGACDLKTGKLFYFENGSFATALRASSAIPALIPPVFANGTCYVDGGTCENVPFNILRQKGCDVVIAVDCMDDYQKDTLPKGSINTLAYAMEVMQHELIVLNKKTNKKNYDIYCYDITEGVNHMDTDFKQIPNLIESGKKCAQKYAKKIKKIIEKRKIC